MPASRLHPFLRLFLCAIALFFIMTVVQAIGLGVLLAFSARLGLGAVPLVQRIPQIATTYGLPLMVICYPAILGLLYVFRTKVDHFTWRSLGFSRERVVSNFARGAATALLALSVLFSLLWLADAIRFGGWTPQVQTHSGYYIFGQLLFYGLVFVAVGFFEETLFRGYVTANLREWLGWPFALVAQAVLFASVHLMNGAGSPDALRAAVRAQPNLFLIAVFFAVSYRKTGSLWFPIGFHVAWNWLLGCVFSLPVSGNDTFRLFDVQATGPSILTGGFFGAEGSILLTPLVIAMIYAMWQMPDHPRAVANLDAPEPAGALAPQATWAPYPPPQGMSAPLAYASTEPSEEEERGPNRYNSRFGSGTGFDSETLRELKQMQEARDQAERERAEAERAGAQAEELRLLAIQRAGRAAQTQATTVTQPTESAPVAQASSEAPAATETPVQQPTSPSVTAPVAAEPAISAPSAPVAPPAPAPRPAPVAPPATPTAPVTPARPATQQPVPDTTPETPTETTPKKARPRW